MILNNFTVFEIFPSGRQYTIPRFQRKYVWSQERQWAPLWGDILAKVTESVGSNPHFLGAIVLNPQTPSLTKTVTSFDVIDGQQRLTTFQIFFAAFRDVVKEIIPKSPLWEMIRQHIHNMISSKAPQEEKYKLLPTRADTQQFKDIVDCGSRKALEEKHPPQEKRKKILPRPSMIEAYLFFHASILSFAQEGGAAPEDQLELLYQALQSKLSFVAITLDKDDDPQVIFETLNARGEPLQPSDLLRNYVFLRAHKNNEGPDKLYETYWSSFEPHGESSFWQEEVRQGQIKRPKLDLFMQHFLALKTNAEVNLSRLFREYQAWVSSSPPKFKSVEEELKELSKYAALYRKLYEHDEDTRLGLFTRRLSALDTNTVFPLLLSLLDSVEKNKLSLDELEGIVTDLESFLVRRMICNRPTKDYNKLFLGLARDAFKQGITRENLQKYLLSPTSENNNWPDDEAFEAAWGSPLGFSKPQRIEMVLLAIERFYHTSKQEKIEIQSKLTIEHVMPQSWDENWPLPKGSDAEDEARREDAIQSFGNLTLLTQPFNSSLQNDTYKNKRKEIVKQSTLLLNSYFQDINKWNEEAIQARGELLCGVAKEVWPHPGELKPVKKKSPRPAQSKKATAQVQEHNKTHFKVLVSLNGKVFSALWEAGKKKLPPEEAEVLQSFETHREVYRECDASEWKK